MSSMLTVRLSAQQLRLLCEAPDPQTLLGLRDRAFLATLASSGCSVGEVVTLQTAQIGDAPYRSITTIPQARQLMARQAPLSLEAYTYIQAWLAERPLASAYVFTRFDGRGSTRVSAEPMSRTSAWRLVQRYARQVGLVHVKPHDFRRFVGTELTRRRGIRQAQRVLGHRRIETTAQHYVPGELKGGLTDGLY